ncbi:MAG TPA: hypothetical protein VMD91_08735 [Candidatus Sulfotelmatobacter sp.]|nr:hypothetical protein [Candidatus Sulfotelmatobacter sp.]
MTFDQWIDSVDAQVRGRLGSAVKTEEISWDSAMWVKGRSTVVAALADDETTATLSFDNGDKVAIPFAAVAPADASETIARRLLADR